MNHAARHHCQIAFAHLIVGCLVLNTIAPPRVSGSSLNQNVATVESAANFIHERSGVKLSTETKRRLSVMQRPALAGVSYRITVQELTVIVTDILLKRLSTLKDQEIEQAAKTFRGDPNPKYDYILLSWDGKFMSTRRQFVTAVMSFRDKSRRQDSAFQATLKEFVEGKGVGEGVNGRVKLYSKTLPEEFSHALNDGLTPLQAVLILYSLASDDNISASTPSLRAEMEHEHQTIGGSRYPDPTERFPFGAQGYLFPAPVEIIFNETTIGSLLDNIEKKRIG